MQIFVKTVGGPTLCIRSAREESVDGLLGRTACAEGSRLVFGGKQLDMRGGQMASPPKDEATKAQRLRQQAITRNLLSAHFDSLEAAETGKVDRQSWSSVADTIDVNQFKAVMASAPAPAPTRQIYGARASHPVVAESHPLEKLLPVEGAIYILSASGVWRPCQVVRHGYHGHHKNPCFLVHFDGYKDMYDEWVDAVKDGHRIRTTEEHQEAEARELVMREHPIGTPLSVLSEYSGAWRPCHVIEHDDDKKQLLVHFDGYSTEV